DHRQPASHHHRDGRHRYPDQWGHGPVRGRRYPGIWNNTANTNASGQVVRSLATANVRFRVTYNSGVFYSGAAGSCAIPGCTTASITANRTIAITLTSSSASNANAN